MMKFGKEECGEGAFYGGKTLRPDLQAISYEKPPFALT